MKKIKNKPPGDIIILHKCIKNHDFMLHVYRDMVDEIVFHFGLFFALLPNLQPKKLKFQKNEKHGLRYHHFTQVNQKS